MVTVDILARVTLMSVDILMRVGRLLSVDQYGRVLIDNLITVLETNCWESWHSRAYWRIAGC